MKFHIFFSYKEVCFQQCHITQLFSKDLALTELNIVCEHEAATNNTCRTITMISQHMRRTWVYPFLTAEGGRESLNVSKYLECVKYSFWANKNNIYVKTLEFLPNGFFFAGNVLSENHTTSGMICFSRLSSLSSCSIAHMIMSMTNWSVYKHVLLLHLHHSWQRTCTPV